MKLNPPNHDRSRRSPSSAAPRHRGRALLLCTLAVGLMLTTACDDDDDDPQSGGGEDVVMGTVVQTFTASERVSDQPSSLVVNIIDTGSSAASTGGVMTPRGGGMTMGNASNGILVITSDVRVLLSGTTTRRREPWR